MQKEVKLTLERGSVINDIDQPEWPSNEIRTTKYEWYNFLFINLWEQLHKFSTVYFLGISILMYLGEKTDLFVGTIKYFTTLAQQVCLMILSGAMALRDDLQRRASDSQINNSTTRKWDPAKKTFEDTLWMRVRVGDLLLVSRESEFPADIVPLYSTGTRGSIFVSTANLDGETNLKTKSTLPRTQKLVKSSKSSPWSFLSGLQCKVGAEAPVDNIHNFQGYIEYEGETLSLGPDQLLLRGTMLRNTEYVLGIVVYTGANTRMVLNSRKAPIKQSSIEQTTNKVMMLVLFTQAVLALISDIAYQMNRPVLLQHWYLVAPETTLPIWPAYWLTFFVLYSNLMPITLYGTVDVCNFFHAYFIKNDKKICYLDPEGGEDHFPAGVRATNLCQELGQVSYVFSDKTGTLTQNVMELKRACLGGVMYGNRYTGFSKGAGPDGQELDESKLSNDQGAREFLKVLSVCHTVMVSDKPGELKYEAESPDDEALVKGASLLGWKFTGRVGQSVIVEEFGEKSEYTIVATNAFTSARKRMSTVVKVVKPGAGEQYMLLAKGADNLLKPLLKDQAPDSLSRLESAVDEFAREGLRTLVIASRNLEAASVSRWLEEFKKANADLGDRAGQLEKVADLMEKELELCGVTGIEDKLQDGVPETIGKIRIAGIKFWVLTGDKLETAKEIGYSANVLDRGMEIHEVEKANGAVLEQLERVWRSCQPTGNHESEKELQDRQGRQALMITGDAIMEIMADQRLKKIFLEIGKEVSIVMGCRVSPLQKQQMVQVVRENVKDKHNRPLVTLAIGDGANDVPMIQSAEVGVGIKGKEGLQSVNNSDFAIGQFRHLERLMFVHGRWNYLRACKYTLFTFWRNAVQVFMIAFFTYISGFSGTSLFEDSIRLTFNGFASVPIVATGVFDQDVDEATAIAHPELYRVGREQVQLSLMKMGWTLVSAFSHSVILQLVWYFAFDDMTLLGVGDYYSFGTACFTGLLFGVFYRNLFLQYTHNRYTIGSMVLCFFGYVGYLVFLCFVEFMEPNMYRVPYKLASILPFWLCVICAPMMAAAFDTFVDFCLEFASDTQWQLLQDRVNALDDMACMGVQKGYSFTDLPFYDKLIGKNKTQDQEALLDAGRFQVPSQGLGPPDDTGQEPRDEKYKEAGIDISPFAQQTLDPLICVDFFQTPRARYCNAVALFFIGVFLVIVGGVYVSLANGVVAKSLRYSDQCTNVSCDMWIEIPESMKDGEILVSYMIYPFYQNHNDYENSESIPELYGDWDALADIQTSRHKKCFPQNRKTHGMEIVPCGMKATSMFNDTFTFEVEGHQFELDERAVAWDSDRQRYNNPSIYGTLQNRIQWLNKTYPSIIGQDGVKTHRFVSWMRPAAKDYVKNSLGFMNSSEIKGKKVRVRIENVFPVEAWGGHKELLFTELNPMGGAKSLLGWFLCVGGILCLVVSSALLLWVRMYHPHMSENKKTSQSGAP